MAKPKTSYTNIPKPPSTFAEVVKNASSFAGIPKNGASFTGISKSDTTYNRRGTFVDPWFLNSTFLQLNSTYYLLNGFGNNPSEIDITKVPITYTPV